MRGYHPARFEYYLTDVGKDLYPVILTLRQWGDRHLADADGPPTVFTHRCGHPLRARLVCESCGEPAVPGHSRPAVAGQRVHPCPCGLAPRCDNPSGVSSDAPDGLVAPPGTERPRRYRPRLRYELIDCGLHGHELLGLDAARLRDEDSVFAREAGGLRWYRCLRCDSWVALSPPRDPAAQYPPHREEVILPLRGRPLRDRYVLRLIALDRVLHFLVLAILAVALILFAHDRAMLNADFTRIVKDLQGGLGGPVNNSKHGIVYDLRRLFTISTTNLYLVAAGIAAYAVLEGTEAVGLWLGRRWAEYLTFVATVVFVPFEIRELTRGVSWLKVLALVINLLIVIYLLFAKRLFGLRGGGKAERAERERDTGWAAIERATPGPSVPVAPPKGPAGTPD
jgi:uncharacterized membrane protein (DUF2068 family)